MFGVIHNRYNTFSFKLVSTKPTHSPNHRLSNRNGVSFITTCRESWRDQFGARLENTTTTITTITTITTTTLSMNVQQFILMIKPKTCLFVCFLLDSCFLFDIPIAEIVISFFVVEVDGFTERHSVWFSCCMHSSFCSQWAWLVILVTTTQLSLKPHKMVMV